jgi:hypothetical protein
MNLMADRRWTEPLPGAPKTIPGTAGQDVETAAEADFVKIEKNLAELGFFTPASKRVKNLRSKTVNFSRDIEGNRVDCQVTFVPGALYGLPSTSDQDKWLAFQKFITDLQQESGQIANPITFLSADMLRLLGQTLSGTNFKDIDEWLDRMWSTSIISEGVVYFAGKKIRVKDRTPIKVFTRAVTAGATLDDGSIAEKNYVWLSDWQLENINNNHQMPVDFEAYKKLKNNIAKTLVPLLQIWLYATREKGVFEKRYDEICQLLDTTQYRHASKIAEKLGPSLDELTQQEYLAAWRIEKTSDGSGFKIIFHHGPKFHRDLQRRLNGGDAAGTEVSENGLVPGQQFPEEVDSKLLAELTSRGIGESGARKLLARLPPARPVLALLAWGDQEIARQPGKIENPAGFYIRLLEEHSAPPRTSGTPGPGQGPQRASNAQQWPIGEESRTTIQTEAAERAKLGARIAALPVAARQLLFEQAKADLIAQYPQMAHFFELHAETAIDDGAVQLRMQALLEAGWKIPEGRHR